MQEKSCATIAELASAEDTHSHEFLVHSSLSAAFHISSEISITKLENHVQIPTEAYKDIFESAKTNKCLRAQARRQHKRYTYSTMFGCVISFKTLISLIAVAGTPSCQAATGIRFKAT